MLTIDARASGYAELHAYSNFTFLGGASHPEELAERAAELGLAALALTDRDGLYGSVRFSTHARSRDVAAIVGSELTFEDGARIVLLVENERGYASLCKNISTAQMRGSKGDARLHLEDLERCNEGLIALSGGPHGRIERAIARGDRPSAQTEARRLKAIFPGRLWLELQQHLTPEETQRNAHLRELAARLQLPCVATGGTF